MEEKPVSCVNTFGYSRRSNRQAMEGFSKVLRLGEVQCVFLRELQ